MDVICNKIASVCSEKAAAFGQLLGGVAALLALFIAIVAALVTWTQIKAARASQREASAREVWKDYIALCIQHPDLAGGGMPDAASDPIRFEQYEWFVAFALDACESILLFVAREDEWIVAVRSQISYHADYIGSPVFQNNYKQHYSRQLRHLMDELLSGKPAP